MKLDKKKVDALFAEGEHQAEVMTDLFRMIYPNWDDVEKVLDFPTANEFTRRELCGRFVAFDKQHHPAVMAGGLWLNNGFSNDETLADWEVAPAPVRLAAAAMVAA